MNKPFWLTGVQMARSEPFFPQNHGKPRVDDRRALSGIILINSNGLRWFDAPKEDGPPKTLDIMWSSGTETLTPPSPSSATPAAREPNGGLA